MIDIELRSVSKKKHKSQVTCKLKFANRHEFKDFQMAIAYNKNPIIIEIGPEYATK